MVHFRFNITGIEKCINDEPAECKFPFEYNGKLHYKCIKDGGYAKPWCYDVRGPKNWWDYQGVFGFHWDHCSKCQSVPCKY